MPIPSVRGIAPAVLVAFFLFTPLFSRAQIQGEWKCTTKSGKFNANTDYQIRCAGILKFKSDRILESTCVDGFFPSGVYWETSGNLLTLRDSGGKAFADFEIREISAEKLLLVRKEIHYAFERLDAAGARAGR